MPATKPEYSAQREKALLLDEIFYREYGAPFIFFSEKDPLSELVASILSHRTKNRVSQLAYRQLREALPEWEAVMKAPVEAVQAPISQVTFPEVKAPRIQQALRYVLENTGVLSLDFLKEMEPVAARAWLEKIPGVGVKTSAATLNFSSLRIPALVVDTHHLRVAQRLGIIPFKASLDAGARLLESYLPEEWDGQRIYDSHQGFMRHGKEICHWDRPECEKCLVNNLCDYYQQKAKILPTATVLPL